LGIEPHWVSKDGERMMCMAQLLDAQHQPVGRWREVKAARLPEGTWHITRRARTPRGRLPAEVWRVESRMAEAPRKRAHYLARARHQDGSAAFLVLRLPASSQMISSLDHSAMHR
jgi:hypothetical protein